MTKGEAEAALREEQSSNLLNVQAEFRMGKKVATATKVPISPPCGKILLSNGSRDVFFTTPRRSIRSRS